MVVPHRTFRSTSPSSASYPVSENQHETPNGWETMRMRKARPTQTETMRMGKTRMRKRSTTPVHNVIAGKRWRACTAFRRIGGPGSRLSHGAGHGAGHVYRCTFWFISLYWMIISRTMLSRWAAASRPAPPMTGVSDSCLRRRSMRMQPGSAAR